MVRFSNRYDANSTHGINPINTHLLEHLQWHELNHDSKETIKEDILSSFSSKKINNLVHNICNGFDNHLGRIKSYQKLYGLSLILCRHLHTDIDNIYIFNKTKLKNIICTKLRELVELDENIDREAGLGNLFGMDIIDAICGVLIDCQGKPKNSIDEYFNNTTIQARFINSFNEFFSKNTIGDKRSKLITGHNIYHFIKFICVIYLGNTNNQNGSDLILSFNGYRTNLLDSSSISGLEKLGFSNQLSYRYDYNLPESDKNKYYRNISSYLGQISFDNSDPFDRTNKRGLVRKSHSLEDFSKKPAKALLCLEQLIYYLEKTGHLDDVLTIAMLGRKGEGGYKGTLYPNTDSLCLRNLYNLNLQVAKYNARNPSSKINLADLLNKIGQLAYSNKNNQGEFISALESIAFNHGLMIPKGIASFIFEQEKYREDIAKLVNELFHITDIKTPQATQALFSFSKKKSDINQNIYSCLSSNVISAEFDNLSTTFLFGAKQHQQLNNLQSANITLLNSLFNLSFNSNNYNLSLNFRENLCLHRDLCIQSLVNKYAKLNLNDNANQESIFNELSIRGHHTDDNQPLLKKIDANTLDNILAQNNAEDENLDEIDQASIIIAVSKNKSTAIFRGNILDGTDKFKKFTTIIELEQYLSHKLADNPSQKARNISYYVINDKVIKQTKELSYDNDIIGNINHNEINIIKPSPSEPARTQNYRHHITRRSVSSTPRDENGERLRIIPEITLGSNGEYSLASPLHNVALNQIDAKFSKAINKIETTFREGTETADSSLASKLESLKAPAYADIDRVESITKQKLGLNTNESLSKFAKKFNADNDNSGSSEEYNKTREILDELNESLELMKQNYLQNKQQQRSAYDSQLSSLKHNMQLEIYRARQKSILELKEFEESLSNLTDMQTQTQMDTVYQKINAYR